jgi:uncharacterized membrane protein
MGVSISIFYQYLTLEKIKWNILFIQGFKGNLGSLYMETIIIVVIAVSIMVVIFGFVYYFWCKKNTPMQTTEFSFDDVYQYQEREP